MSFLFLPAFGVVDLEKNEVHGLGSWDTRITVTTPVDIGRLTTEIIVYEPRIANEVVFVAGESIAYGKLADVVERVTGRPVDRVLWTQEDLKAELDKNPEDVMAGVTICVRQR